jgi:5-methylcytosine-specific restriction protein A
MLMWLEPEYLGQVISGETGLAFEAKTGVDAEGQRWYILRPRGEPGDHTFGIRVTLGWRRLRLEFEPGKFAGALLADMGRADETGRTAFSAVLEDCRARGAQIEFRVNGELLGFDDQRAWDRSWQRLVLLMNKGQLELGAEDGEPDLGIVCRWTGRFASAIVAVLPLEEEEQTFEEGVIGYPEGALATVKTNRYERDRRNRAAAISIHGASCHACGVEMGKRYGPIVRGYIEVHHITPVSQLGAGYVIDPARDLIPLCPNCHAIVHRRSPPFSVDEMRAMLNSCP